MPERNASARKRSIDRPLGIVAGASVKGAEAMNMMTAIEAAESHPRGTHSICDDEREIFVELPDLRSGRTLEDALAHLNGIAALDPDSYPREWHEEIMDVGGSASANYPKDGPRHLYVGQPCDAQEDERRRRVDALVDHMHSLEGMYERIGDFLERRGHYTDDRPRDAHNTTIALRNFVNAGFRVFVHPDGQLGTSGGMPAEWVNAGAERAHEIEQAAIRFSRTRRRWRNEAQIRRAIRMLGFRADNGFVILQRKEA
jgi:hypothetical protein